MDLRMSGATLSEVFQQIERQTDYMFVYKIEDVRAVDRVDVNVSHAMVKDVLASCLQGTGLVYVFRDNVIVIQRADDEKPEVEKALTVKGVGAGREEVAHAGRDCPRGGNFRGNGHQREGLVLHRPAHQKGQIGVLFRGLQKAAGGIYGEDRYPAHHDGGGCRGH